MKSWKRAIESLGFKRWKYVKQEHLHCMAFRKITHEHAPTHAQSLLVSDVTPDMLYIPQVGGNEPHLNFTRVKLFLRSFCPVCFQDRDQLLFCINRAFHIVAPPKI